MALNNQPTDRLQIENIALANDGNYCGANLAWQRLLSETPGLLEEQEQLEAAYVRDQKTSEIQRTAGPPYTIPVVFHIVHDGGTENISDAAVQTSLDFLNQSFANEGPYDSGTGVPTEIQFCLAKRTPEGTISSGIERINHPLTNLNMNEDLDLKDLSRYDPTQYLNIWVVREICGSIGCGVAGYAYFPSAHGGNLDGIVVEAGWLGNTPGASSVLTHEVGHYLGLYHTFEGACQNDDCLLDGDRVCDTPPDQSTAAVPCNAAPNSCTTDTNSGFSVDQPDMFQNYMDYGDWDCYSIFTEGQRERMHFFLEGTRASLLSSQGCLDPCLTPVTVEITSDFSGVVAQGEAVDFTATGTNVANYTWFVDGTEVGTGNPFSYVFPNAGSFSVSVQATNSDPNCLAEAETTVSVRCPVQAFFTPNSTNVSIGSVVYFTNGSTEATSFEWQVDGNPAGTDVGFFYQFDAVGTYVVTLVADNGNCSDESALVITVGINGNAQAGLPVWPMQGGSDGGFHTLDWRTTPPLSSTVTALSEESGGITGAAFNSCDGVAFFAAHIAEPNQPNGLFIYSPDGTPLLTNNTPNAPGLNAVRGGELQVIDRPGTPDEWYIIYRNFASDTGAPLNNAAYRPLAFVYSRVRLENDGSLNVLERDQPLTVGGTTYTYSNGAAVSRTVEGDASRQYLYLSRRALNESSLSLDRFIIDNTGISWDANSGTVPAAYWELTHSGSPVELSPTEDRVVVCNRNQWSNYVDYVIFPTDNFSNTAATSIITDDLIVVADGQPDDESSVLPVNLSINQLAGNGTYPLRFLRNFPHKISRMEFSPNGRFLYLVGGGFQSGSSQLTSITYLAQIDLETDPLQVRLQVQEPPGNYSLNSGLGCPISQCLDQWKPIRDLESSYDGNLYFTKRKEHKLFIIPNPNSFLPQKLVPGTVDLATADEPNIDLPGWTGALPDQIDGFNYLSAQSQTVELAVSGLDCAGACRSAFDVQLISSDGSYQETFTVAECPTLITICADTSLSYRLVDVELGVEYANAIVGGEVNAPAGDAFFEFSETQGCPEDCEDASFVKVFGSPEADEVGYSMTNLPNGNLLLGAGSDDYIQLMEISTDGVLVQEQKFSTPDIGVITDLFVDSDGMIVGCGRIGNTTATVRGIAFRYDYTSQDLLWMQETAPSRSSYSIFETSPGGDYIFSGTQLNAPSPGAGDDASWMALERNTGAPNFTVSANDNLGGPDGHFQSIVHNGKVYHSGRLSTSSSPSRFYASVARYSLTGTAEWVRILHRPIGSTARLYAYDIDEYEDELYVLGTGDDNGSSLTNTTVFLYKMSTTGDLLWTREYDIPGMTNDWGHEMTVVSDGLLIYGDELGGDSDLFLFKVDFDGNVLWAKRYLADGSEFLDQNATQIITTAGNSIFLSGATESFGSGSSRDILFMRTTADGSVNADCLAFEELDLAASTVSDAVASPVTLNRYGNTLNFASNNLEPLSLETPLVEDCLALCEEICDNGTDDDGDGLVDCEDPDLADDCCCYLPPTLDLGEDIIRCDNGVVVLDAGPDFETYQWSDLTTEQTLTTLFPGLYTLAVTDRCGNEQVDSISIIVDPDIDIDLGPDQQLCPDQTLTLSADGFEIYEWFPETGFDCNTCPTVTYTATVNDTLIVVGTTAAGCISTDTLLVSTAGEQQGSFATADLCQGDTLPFGDMAITEAGLYIDTISVGECVAIDSLQVSILPTFSSSEEVAICAGESITLFGTEEVTEAGVYSMDLTAENGCDSTHTVSVSIRETFETSETLPDHCAEGSVEVFGNTVTESGTFTETFTAANGCDSTHTINLTFLPPNETAEDIFICEGESVEVFGNMIDEPGAYTESFTAANGCDSTHTITLIGEEFTGGVNIFPPCPSKPEAWMAFIRTNGNGGPYTVTWNGNIAVDNTIHNVPVGDHVAEVTSANGCMYTVEFTIRPYQPWWALVTGPSCDNPRSGSIQLETEPSEEEITFSLDGENFSPASTLENLEEGDYVLYVKYGERCVFTDTMTVPGPEAFSLLLPEDKVIEWGEHLPIEPTTDVSAGAVYSWYPSETLDCANCDKVVASTTETTRYYLEITDAVGCTQIDDILVKVDRRIPYYVPNAFSPNGDGRNDFFTVFGDDRIEEIERMIIFDRWGGQVFIREMFPPNREQLGWNGKNRQQEINTGVYAYYFELRLATGEVVTVKGDVALLK